MAFDVTFYTFGKKTNSTARPSSAGTTYSCVANDPISITAPVVTVKRPLATAPTANYAYISAFGRYYWVTNWVCSSGLWSSSLAVDALATYKTQIGTQTLYILRSASAYNGLLTDDKYQMTGDWSVNKQTHVTPWASALVSRANGRFVVGLTGSTAVHYYLFEWSGFQSFMLGLFSDTYAGDVLTALGIALYPEAKIAVNPIQFISSIVYIPYAISTSSLTQVTEVKVGTATVSCTAYEFTYSSTITVGDDITFSVPLHPQGTTRGAYLNRPPYTDYRLFFPPFGMMALDGYMVARSASIKCRWFVDCHTGQGALNVYAVRDSAETMIAHVSGQIGVSYEVGQTITPYWGAGTVLQNLGTWMTSLISPVGAMSPEGAISGAFQQISTYTDMYRSLNVDPYIPQHSSVGTYGGYAGLAGGPVELLTTFKTVADDDLTHFGRPLCEDRQLNTLSGFIQCRDADVSISGATVEELQDIQTALLAGFFME